MKVSINWAQQQSSVDLSSIPKAELLKKIGAQLGAIEEVTEWGPRYNGIVVVEVISCDPHPNADKLHVCRIDDNKVVKDIERGEDGLVQVVCGAPNVQAGMTVAWLPPGSTVPSTINKDPFVLGTRELRGVISNGMLASAAELGLGDDHSGLLEIKSEEVGDELCKPGTDFKKLYGLDDLVVDCENKMFTHRPDCFGILGVARELAGITGQQFKSPNWYRTVPRFKDVHDVTIKASVTTKLVPRFMLAAMQNISVASSPIYMQSALTRVGIRPINNVVDITNYMMHLSGQPMHAYDLDKVKALCSGDAQLVARLSKKGEIITLLSGKQVELDDSTIVIATDQQLVGIAGVMGGANTEVDVNTKNILIEVASFDMYAIRKASMKYGVFTDAVTRFNKGQSPLQNGVVLAEAMRLFTEITGGQQSSIVHDVKAASVVAMPPVTTTIDFINTRLGSSLSADDVRELFKSVECEQQTDGIQESRSYIKGVDDISGKLERIGVKIQETTSEGHYKVIIPIGTEAEYEKLINMSLKPGFWNEYIGAKNVFIFKNPDQKVNRYEVSDDTEHEIIETCRTFSNEFYSSIETMLSLNNWYRPLLPLKKSFQLDAVDANEISISPPFWRRDLELPEDLVEEVGRLYGFDKLPVVLPARSALAVAKNPMLQLHGCLRSTLSRAGANELVTYSFVHQQLLSVSGQDSATAFHVRNAISPDLQYYRLSLTPSLLDKVHLNIKAGFSELCVFEIGKSHNKLHQVAEGQVPTENEQIALVVAAKDSTQIKKRGAAYYTARKYLDYMALSLGLSLVYEPVGSLPDFPVTKPFDPQRSAVVKIEASGIILGVIGEYTQQVRQALKLPVYCAGFEVGIQELANAAKSGISYIRVAKFPKTQQDATYEVNSSLNYAKISQALSEPVSQLMLEHGYQISVLPGDIFVPKDSKLVRYSFRFVVHHPDRTLTSSEVTKAVDYVSKHVAGTLHATQV